MLGFIVFVLTHFLVDPPRSYEAWRGWVASPGVSMAAVLFVAALFTHAWVSLRDVTLDYVAPLAARVTALTLIATALLAAAAWSVRILLLARG
jgi:succinate dehydrogenase / fumarate reductase membrane anchor subunit